MPCDMVRFPWGSMSTHNTRCPSSAKAAARFNVVVVLATPPFWLAKAMTLALPVTRAPIEVWENPSARYSQARPKVLPTEPPRSRRPSGLACGHDGRRFAGRAPGGQSHRDLRWTGWRRQDDDLRGDRAGTGGPRPARGGRDHRS